MSNDILATPNGLGPGGVLAGAGADARHSVDFSH